MSEGISLGWNCKSASEGVSRGIRNTKQNGYKTCPFDEMVSNLTGIIDCLNDDFEYFCDSRYLQLIKIPTESKYASNETMIYNTKYKFIFNHESPGHADLYITQNWSNGINHYILNDFEEFKKRYIRRIQNMKDLLNSGKSITFILTRYNTRDISDVSLLNTTIANKYPSLVYSFLFLDVDKTYMYDHLKLMLFDENSEEIQRIKRET